MKLTRRKKQNLLYMGIGVLIGLLIASGIAYFSVIKQFTQSNIDKIQFPFPTVEKDSVQITTPKPTKKSKKETKTIEENKDIQTNDSTQTNDNSAETEIDLIIKTETKIDSSILPIVYIETDSMEQTEKYPRNIIVEQWENPTNFAGYRKKAHVLIIYGISIYDIELQYTNNKLYLVYNDNKIAIEESDSFVRFPSSFIAR